MASTVRANRKTTPNRQPFYTHSQASIELLLMGTRRQTIISPAAIHKT
ncbi:hypothetical protein H6F77_10580 [Microcoleus sp. FACHB-831]|nr:hypothetical protein [Microcoleus sp. FACHB-831]